MRLKTFGGLRLELRDSGDDVLTRPRSLALLAILATAGSRGISREQVLGILWPESAPDRARHALAQTVYNIRNDLGAAVAQGSHVLRLETTVLTSDVEELRCALAAKHWSEAAALYAGPFLDGFYLADAPEFERWADQQRARYAADAARAIEHAARELAEAGRLEAAAAQWLRLATMEPLDSRFAVAYMDACAASGKRADALAYGRSYVRLVREELDVEPDATVLATIARLRDADTAVGDPSPTVVVANAEASDSSTGDREPIAPETPATVAHAVVPPAFSEPRERSRATSIAAALITVAAIAVAMASTSAWRGSDPSTKPPVLAVGEIRDLTPNAAARDPRGVLIDMLATSLGRVPDLHVIASSRMLELMPRDGDTSRAATMIAARRAGATEIVEGELLSTPDGKARLQLRRVDLEHGLVRGGYEIAGVDRFAVFDSVPSRFAADLGFAARSGSLAEMSTRSPVAYRLYEAGLHAFYRFDIAGARRLFDEATREDSTFAMATYYAWRVANLSGDANQTELAHRAVRLAAHASVHDRLLIRTHVGGGDSDLGAFAAAESLVTLYPRDPEALMRAAEVVADRSRAIALLRRSIAIDSAAGVQPGGICRMCDALKLLASVYEWEDSMPAAEATLRRWTALRPEDFAPWSLLSDLLVAVGRRDEAMAAQRRAIEMGALSGDTAKESLIQALRLDDLDLVRSRCPTLLASVDDAAFGSYRWYCTIGLRMLGRYDDAVALIHEGRLPGGRGTRRGSVDHYQRAILAMETGHGAQAVDEFHRLAMAAARDTTLAPAFRSRLASWLLTLTATAAVTSNDTAYARRLIDSIQVMGRASSYGRDPLLHHFVRGLLFARAGQDGPAERELRASIFSPTRGYTRANYELARVLQRLGRPRDAIPVVRAALHGGIEGSGLYVTRTEMHECMAELFDVTGQADSAVAHYAIVERAWRTADASFRDRHDRAARRLIELRH